LFVMNCYLSSSVPVLFMILLVYVLVILFSCSCNIFYLYMVCLRATWAASGPFSAAGPRSPKLSCCARPAGSSPTTCCRTSSCSRRPRAHPQITPCSMASLPPSGQLTNTLYCFMFLILFSFLYFKNAKKWLFFCLLGQSIPVNRRCALTA